MKEKELTQKRTKVEYKQGTITEEIATSLIVTAIAFIISLIFFKSGVYMAIVLGIVSIAGVLFRASGIKVNNATLEGKCPHCDKDIWINAVAYTDGSKFNCPLCGNAVEYRQSYFYPSLGAMSNEVKDNTNTDFSKLKELKELLDMGAITQEEYDSQKNKLLNK